MAVLQPLQLPQGGITSAWVPQLAEFLKQTSWRNHTELRKYLGVDTVVTILKSCAQHLQTVGPLVEVNPSPDCRVTVVGDTHGQLHDVLTLFDKTGFPSDSSSFVFNGDFVDRGSWGLEVLILLAAWHLALPQAVHLLRGNHESSSCTVMYGFQQELRMKYSEDGGAQKIYLAAEQLFMALPLGACIAGNTLVVHGGLWRAAPPPAPANGRKRRKVVRTPMAVGSLDDLRAAFKGGPDPSGRNRTVTAADAMWSDPVLEPGLRRNTARGVGLVFGPDVTQQFMEDNSLRLIIRSHEGPDARYMVEDRRANIKEGFSIDHITPVGNLYTVFSAPDYPQHQAEGEERYNNLAAVALLRGPTWAEPEMLQFAATLPRPPSVPFYDLATPGSDEEFEAAGGASEASSIDDGHDEPHAVEVESTAVPSGHADPAPVSGPEEELAPAAPAAPAALGQQQLLPQQASSRKRGRLDVGATPAPPAEVDAGAESGAGTAAEHANSNPSCETANGHMFTAAVPFSSGQVAQDSVILGVAPGLDIPMQDVTANSALFPEDSGGIIADPAGSHMGTHATAHPPSAQSAQHDRRVTRSGGQRAEPKMPAATAKASGGKGRRVEQQSASTSATAEADQSVAAKPTDTHNVMPSSSESAMMSMRKLGSAQIDKTSGKPNGLPHTESQNGLVPGKPASPAPPSE